MPLTDKVAIVIGATGQLGPAVAKAFAHSGARLVLVSNNHERLALLFNELGFRESRVMTHVANAMDEAAMQDLADAVTVRFGRADILLHLAGGYRGGSLRDTQGDVWEYLLNLNLRTAVNSMRAFLPLLMANNWGRIITISSGITQSPPPNVAAYVTAKAALETMTIAVAQEVKDKNITANVVLIRSLDTPTEAPDSPNGKRVGCDPKTWQPPFCFYAPTRAGQSRARGFLFSEGVDLKMKWRRISSPFHFYANFSSHSSRYPQYLHRVGSSWLRWTFSARRAARISSRIAKNSPRNSSVNSI